MRSFIYLMDAIKVTEWRESLRLPVGSGTGARFLAVLEDDVSLPSLNTEMTASDANGILHAGTHIERMQMSTL